MALGSIGLMLFMSVSFFYALTWEFLLCNQCKLPLPPVKLWLLVLHRHDFSVFPRFYRHIFTPVASGAAIIKIIKKLEAGAFDFQDRCLPTWCCYVTCKRGHFYVHYLQAANKHSHKWSPNWQNSHLAFFSFFALILCKPSFIPYAWEEIKELGTICQDLPSHLWKSPVSFTAFLGIEMFQYLFFFPFDHLTDR